MAKKILLVEDEPQIVAVVRGYLLKAGFEVLSTRDGRTGLFMVRQERPDLVILDLMLPSMDGLDVARAIRQDNDPLVANVALIMLTARVEEDEKLLGLEVGADDYIPKPFSPRELVARVRALLRRVERTQRLSLHLLRRGPLTLDKERRLLFKDEKVVNLTPTEFDLLATMMAVPGRPFTRLELLQAASSDPYEGDERTIDVHIKNLRRKLGDKGRAPRFIQTVLNHGYRFAADL